MVVSDLKAGGRPCQKELIVQRDIGKKGPDPKWSNQIVAVRSSHGNPIILNDSSKYKWMHLLKVDHNAQTCKTNPIDESRSITKDLDKQSKDN